MAEITSRLSTALADRLNAVLTTTTCQSYY